MLNPDRNYPASMLRFVEAYTSEVQATVLNMPRDEYENVVSALRETLISEEGSLPATRKNLNDKETYLQKVAFAFQELHTSYMTLLDLVQLAQIKPKKKNRLTPSGTLTFWRETYLNELYIFNLRAQSFVKRIGKSHKADKGVSVCAKEIARLIQEHFKPILQIRGKHVHDHRYQHHDPELARLVLLELLITSDKFNKMKPLYDAAIKRCQKQTTKNFGVFNAMAKDALKAIFDNFDGTLVHDSGKLRYPASLSP